MRRLVNYLINNIREHLMLYLFLWGYWRLWILSTCFIFNQRSVKQIDKDLIYLSFSARE